MLTDESMQFAQQSLRQQFPHLDGLYDNVLGPLGKFSVIKSESKFIKLIHTGELHWI